MRFDLIFAVVRSQQVKTALRAAPACKQPIARDARSLLYAACRFLSRPGKDLMADCSCRQPIVKPPDLLSALRPEPMVHCQGADCPAPRARPAIGKNGEREAIGTAGHADGKKWAGFEARERGDCSPEFGEGQRFRRWPPDQQPSRFFSAADRSLIAFPGFGKSRSSCASATQAFCFWLTRASDIPSFNRSSAAFAPLG